MANTTNFGWETPDDTDLVKDGAAAMRTLGQAIDTSLVDLKGGTTGQVLSKATNTDMDFTWVAQDDSNAIQNAIIDAKGDLIVGASADTPARLAAGTNGYYLSANSSATNGVEWVAPPSSGSMTLLDTVNLTSGSSQTSTTLSGSYKDLYIVIYNYYADSPANAFIRFNSDSGSNYNSTIFYSNSTAVNQEVNVSYIWFASQFANSQQSNASTIIVSNYANQASASTATKKNVSIQSIHNNSGTYATVGFGSYMSTSAITTVSFHCNQNWSAGTAKIYGVN